MMTRLSQLSAALLLTASALPAAAAQNDAGRVFVDVRARHETVEQDGKLDAEASTVRTRLGWQSPDWQGLTILIEGEHVASIGSDNYNSGLNGRTAYATIKDDDVTELNRLQLRWQASDAVAVTVGRQLLSFNGNRFIGSPAWRQDRNSHDAVRVDYAGSGWTATYVYHDRVLRGPGDDFDWDSDSHLFNIGHAVNAAVNLEAFAYFIDLTDAAAPQDRSNISWGARLTGSLPLGTASLDYAALVAQQSDYGSSTADFDLGMVSLDASLGRDGARLLFGYDVLEGDGVNTFATPLGSGHAFHGWADAFSVSGGQTTVDGLRDLRFGGRYGRETGFGFVTGWEVGAMHRDFETERGGADLGREWDAWLTLDLRHNLELSMQYADFDGSADALAPTDRRKSWVVLTYSR